MTALNFPASPTVGQIYTANGRSWKWDGVSWISANQITSIGVTGSTMTIYGSPIAYPDATSMTFANSISLSAASTKTLTLNGGAGSNGLVLDASNNVGIGAASGGTKLSVTSASAQGAAGFYTPCGSGQTAIALFQNTTNNGYFTVTASGASSAVPTWIDGSLILEGVPYSTGNTIISSYSGALTFQTGSRTERARITSAGNLGIGTTSPTVLRDKNIEVSSSGTNDGAAVIVGKRGTGIATVRLTGLDTNVGTDINFNFPNTGDFAFFDRAANVTRMKIDSSGIVTMPAYGAGAATFSAAGVISSVSDETWKTKDGVPFDTDAMLKKLEPGYWYYNDEKKEIFGVDRQLGFYAQNVNAAIGPEAAPEPEEGKPWGYYDRSVLAVVVMSLQKALSTIESLEARIAALESN